jgi:preprotein translocase subunit SecY
MVSAVEQMAANTSWGQLAKASDLRSRILFTILLLIVCRVGTIIPVPGIDGLALQDFMVGAAAGLGGILSMFTGGALGRMGIFALGIMAYISASIIVQLLTAMVPSREQLKKEGDAGLWSGRVAGGRRAGDRSWSVFPRFLRDHAGGRHHVHDVAG